MPTATCEPFRSVCVRVEYVWARNRMCVGFVCECVRLCQYYLCQYYPRDPRLHGDVYAHAKTRNHRCRDTERV